jgi:hypothetical protein
MRMASLRWGGFAPQIVQVCRGGEGDGCEAAALGGAEKEELRRVRREFGQLGDMKIRSDEDMCTSTAAK